jgi:large subunit ribosomal protein L21
MLAVIKTGGKQYIVSPGQKIKIEKVDKKEGSEISFDEVLVLAYSPSGSARLGDKNKPSTRAKLGAGPVPHLNEVSGAGKIEIGQPLVKGARVIGKVLKQGKNKKVIVFKFEQTNRYHVKKGHRQSFTEVEITDIVNKDEKAEK